MDNLDDKLAELLKAMGDSKRLTDEMKNYIARKLSWMRCPVCEGEKFWIWHHLVYFRHQGMGPDDHSGSPGAILLTC